jgi:hypothetical protein
VSVLDARITSYAIGADAQVVTDAADVIELRLAR